MNKKIKIAFMGSPKFALKTLDVLYNNENIDLNLVVSAKDKKRNRNKYMPTAVKEYALKNGIDVITPTSVNTDDFIGELTKRKIDFIVVVAFGQLIKEDLINHFKNRIINLHPSALPKYRGASPIQYTLLNGETKTYATAMLIEKGMDSGDILNQKEYKIKEDDDFTSLSEKLSELGSSAILESILDYDEKFKNRIKQDDEMATFTKKIDKDMAKIDWNDSKINIVNKIRAFVEYPKAYFSYKGENVKILKAKAIDMNDSKPSFVYKANKNDLIEIGCKDGAIRVEKIQFPNKNIMDVKSFLLGNNFEEGIFLD